MQMYVISAEEIIRESERQERARKREAMLQAKHNEGHLSRYRPERQKGITADMFGGGDTPLFNERRSI